MASNLPQTTLRFEESDEKALAKIMLAEKFDSKNKMILYMIHNWARLKEKIEVLEDLIEDETEKVNFLSSLNEDVLNAFKTITNSSKKFEEFKKSALKKAA